MADTLEIFGTEYTNVAGIIATNNNNTDLTYIRPQGTKSITANGTGIDVAEYASVNVSVSSEAPTIQSLSVTPSETAQTFNASGVDGYKPVSVSAISSTYVGSGIARKTASDATITWGNGNVSFVAPAGYYASGATLSTTYKTLSNPSITIDSTGLITSSLTISANGPYKAQTVSATEQLTLNDSDDLTVSGATVTAPAGYYAEAASKSVSSMTLPTAATSSATSGYTSKATIGRSTAAQYINIPPGYNSAGAYYVISAVANGLATAPDSISGTAASVSTGDGTLTLTKTVSVTPTVDAGYVISGTAGNSSVSLTANVTIDPTPTASGATVTIPAGYYTDSTTKSVSSGSATGPTSLSGSSATITTGTNTITLTKTGVATTPTVSAGYVSNAIASTATVALTASVTVNPTPTASGATVTIPAGYYSAQTTKSVTTMTLPTSAAASATSGYTKKATISRSTSTQYINIAPGYNSAGGYYEISAMANGSATGPSSLSGSSATVSTGTNTLTLTKTGVTTTPTVTAGYVSSATASTATVTLTASVTTKATATITPTTTNQTIAAGTYLTGTQTIAGDADLVGSNILSTANIFGVQGTVDFIDVYIRSAAPTSSVGNDGDIYIHE